MYTDNPNEAQLRSMKIQRLLERADQHINRGYLTEAIYILNEVLTIDPENITALIDIADCLIKCNLHSNARKYAEKAYKLYRDEDDMAAVNLSCVLTRPAESEHIIEILEREKRLGSKNELIYNNLGYFYYLDGKYVEALENYNISIKLFEDNPLAYCNRGVLKYFIFNEDAEGTDDLIKADKYGDIEARNILRNIIGDKSCVNNQ